MPHNTSSDFSYVMHYFVSILVFAIILKRKRKLVALLLLSYIFSHFCSCIVTLNVVWLFLMVPWICLQCAIVVFPGHTHFLNASSIANVILPTDQILQDQLSESCSRELITLPPTCRPWWNVVRFAILSWVFTDCQRTSDGANGNHSVSLPVILIN